MPDITEAQLKTGLAQAEDAGAFLMAEAFRRVLRAKFGYTACPLRSFSVGDPKGGRT